MKQSIFDKIRSCLSGQIRRFSNHYFGCCNKITKNCKKCKYVGLKENEVNEEENPYLY